MVNVILHPEAFTAYREVLQGILVVLVEVLQCQGWAWTQTADYNPPQAFKRKISR